MAEFLKFRTAFNGFHRADVAQYIETTSLKYQRELNALRAENKRLIVEKEAAEEALRRYREQADLPESAPQEPVPAQNVTERELEAYRRAEAAERNALQRAAKLREKLEALCGGAAERCTETEERAKQLSEEADGFARKMQQTVQQLEGILDDVQAAMQTLELPE